MKWVDGGKAIFKVSTNVVSTVYTQVSKTSLLSLMVFYSAYCWGCSRFAPVNDGIGPCLSD